MHFQDDFDDNLLLYYALAMSHEIARKLHHAQMHAITKELNKNFLKYLEEHNERR